MEHPLNFLMNRCHQASLAAGWWDHPHTENKYFLGTKLCLIHSEVSEAMEGFRTNALDDKLPHRTMAEVELADAIIRILDLAGSQGFDIGGAVEEKLRYNETRLDHQKEVREAPGGKKF